MTLGSLRSRVKFWQHALALDHWRFNVKIVNSKPMGHEGAGAAVDFDDHYDYATIEFLRQQVDDLSPEDCDRLIVHELLHVHMRDYDAAVEYVSDQLDDAAYDVWKEALNHAQEGFIERIAFALVTLNGE